MLEKMDAFFDARVEGYDKHMLEEIEGAKEFYPFTAEQLPREKDATVLDLGCGTGLELEWYYALNPTASVTGIDLAFGMLLRLQEKFKGKKITLIRGSYFDIPFEEGVFYAAVSVESLHHFTKEEKIPLYKKLCASLRKGGCFILTDYFALSDEEECACRKELLRLKKEAGIPDDVFYHYDTPLTVQHERETLLEAGFRKVEILKNWGATYSLRAEK